MSFTKLSPEDLRKHKGLSFPGITTIFFCHDGAGSLLLGKRSNKARDEHGRWDPGAGGLKHGQTAEQNLKRELMEEYGAKAEAIDFLGYMDVFRKNPEGYDTHWLALYFAVKVDPKHVSIKEPDIIDEIGWFKLDNLPTPMHSQFSFFMAKHGNKLKKYMGIID
ncbi:MAG TPA: NUDIX domain-containing protein [Candidatus Saccharimonadales bacterium]|nr:NUDIX domain-containing protein [Candidatus Saccharimonadales bacterium]